MTPEDAPRLYADLAPWFHLLTAPEDYAEEAERYGRIIEDFVADAGERRLKVLELGSGGGNNASHMKEHFDLTLTDRSESMLEISRSLNPECEHLAGDMRTMCLEGREFDAVFVHDAVSYITSQDDLRATIETAYAHCRPGGVALFMPDYVRERFETGSEEGGHDEQGSLRGMRYLQWFWDPDPSDDEYRVDFAYLLRDADGEVRTVHDVHRCGMFRRDTWLQLLGDAGFEAEVREQDSDDDITGSELFVAKKPV